MRIFRRINKNKGVAEVYFPGAEARRFFASKKQGDYLILKFDSIPEDFAALGIVKKNNILKITSQVNIVKAIDLLMADANYLGDYRNKQLFEKLENYREKLYQKILKTEYLKQLLMGDAYKAVSEKFPCLDLNQNSNVGQQSQKSSIQIQLEDSANLRKYILQNPKIINQIIVSLEENKEQLKTEIAKYTQEKRFIEAEVAKELSHTINTEEVRQKFTGMVTGYLEENAKKLLLMQICELISGILKAYVDREIKGMPTFFRFMKSAVTYSKIKLAMDSKNKVDAMYKAIDMRLEIQEENLDLKVGL